jgi:hypothetical protein
MDQSLWCRGPEFGDMVPLEAVRAEIEEIESLDRSIGDLTALLRTRLSPEQFRLVWELRDAVERLAVAEGLLRERRLADELAHHLPRSSAAMWAVRRHLSEDGFAVDEVG